MKVADLYIRVSTDEQADKGYSQRNQEEVLRRYCEINTITVRKIIFEDYSAKIFNRPAWATFLKSLYRQKGQTDLVLFTKWDRFSADDQIPLRGFLNCPRCNRMLTGIGSKGRKYRYYYYHCTSTCGVRYQADFVNGEFERELKKYVPHKAATELYKAVILEAWNAHVKDQKHQKKALITQIGELNTRITKGRELLLANDTDAVDFKTIKSECEKQINILEAKLTATTNNQEDITPTLSKAVDNLAYLDKIYQTATTIKKRQIVGSIFPEKLTFECQNFRTTKLNEAVQLIYSLDAAFRQKENGTSDIFVDLSHQVIPLGLSLLPQKIAPTH